MSVRSFRYGNQVRRGLWGLLLANYLGDLTAPPASGPAAPSGVTLNAISPTTMQIDWTNNDGGAATGIQMDISTDNSTWTSIWGTGSIPTSLRPDVNQYLQTGLIGSQQYWIRIRAINSSGNSAYASNNMTMPAQGAPTNAPNNFTATASGANTINLSWAANSSEGGTGVYNLDRSFDGKTNWIAIFAFSNSSSVAGTTTFSDNGLPPNTTAYYRVRGVSFATAADGTSPSSPFSTIVNATTGSGTGPVTKYVATTGNDSTGDGSIGNPWLTIAHGLANVTPGSTLYLRAGTYAQTSTTLNIALCDVTLAAYNGEAVFLTGGTTGGIVLHILQMATNTCVRNIDISGLTTAVYAFKWETGGWFLDSVSDLAATQNSTTVTSNRGTFTSSLAGRYLTILHSGNGNFVPGVYLISSFVDANTMVLERAPATAGNGTSGVAVIGGGILDTCVCHDTSTHIVKSATFGGSNMIAANCTVYNAVNNGFDLVVGNNIIVQDCIVHNVPGTGINIKGGGRNVLFQRNHIYSGGTGSYGIWLGQSTDADLFDLTMNSFCRLTDTSETPWEAIDCSAINNRIDTTDNAAIQSQGSIRSRIVNNTFYHGAGTNNQCVIYCKDQDTVTSLQCSDMVIVNNVFQSVSTQLRGMIEFHTDGHNGSLTCDNNIYFVEGSGALTFRDPNGVAFATWKTQGNDAHGVNSDPKLSTTGSPATLNLTTGSPAIDAGQTYTLTTSPIVPIGFVDDYTGAVRPKGAGWDIGADEFA